jgi:tripartite-type tricarboxylate transporter receptor subunit TctC
MKLLKPLLLATLLAVHSFSALAQAYPVKGRELKVIVGYPPGSGADTSVRFYSAKLAEVSGNTVIVENRPGMISSLGADAVAKAPPDGHTILLASVTSSHAANLVLFKKLPYDPVRDFTPVTTLYRTTFILMVDANSPHRTVAGLTEALRAKGNKASYGYGSPPALAAAELYKARVGLQALGISYKTSVASMPEMYSGALDFQFIDATFASAQMRAGKLRGLAITSGQRSSLIDLPTMAEAANIPEFDIAPWWGVFLPAGAPQPIVSRLESWFNQIAVMDDTRKYLAGNGAEPLPGNSGFLAEQVQREIRKWAELAKIARIEPQ